MPFRKFLQCIGLRNIFVAATLLTTACNASAESPADSWVGLSGEKLFQAVAAYCTPKQGALVSLYSGENGLWHIMEQTDSDGDYFVNRLGTDVIAVNHTPQHIPSNGMLMTVVPNEWLVTSGRWYKDCGFDLYNLWPATTNDANKKGNYPPGIITQTSTWVGTGDWKGNPRTFWQPPTGLLGETARILMYELTVAHAELQGWDSNFTREYAEFTNYPVFTAEAATMLTMWHRQEPPSTREKLRNDVFSSYQGNRNPFVDYPELAEYLWGTHRGEPFAEEQSIEPPGDDINDTRPLQARYRLSDSRINLISPYIPADARWEVDGTAVIDTYLIPEKLGLGNHELRFSSATKIGKVIIRITN